MWHTSAVRTTQQIRLSLQCSDTVGLANGLWRICSRFSFWNPTQPTVTSEQKDGMIDQVTVVCPTWHKIGHFGDVLLAPKKAHKNKIVQPKPEKPQNVKPKQTHKKLNLYQHSFLRTAHGCVCVCVCVHIIVHKCHAQYSRTVLIIFPFILQTIIIAQMTPTGVEGRRTDKTRMWANAQRDGRPAEYRWRPLFNATRFGWRQLLDCRAVTLPRCESRWD